MEPSQETEHKEDKKQPTESPPPKQVELVKWNRGVINPKMVRKTCFSIISVSLLVCTVLCILAIWEFTESDAVWRAIATFAVIAGASGIFAVVNEKFGEPNA